MDFNVYLQQDVYNQKLLKNTKMSLKNNKKILKSQKLQRAVLKINQITKKNKFNIVINNNVLIYLNKIMKL